MRAKPYVILPFRFLRISSTKVLLTNEVGELIFLPSETFNEFVSGSLPIDSKTFSDLKSKHIATNTEVEPIIDMLATKYRTKKRFLYDFTSLHMIIPTLRCNSNCIYCQASSKETNSKGYDMDKYTAKKIVEMIFKTPSPQIKIEFQGGEPLLNFEIVKYIIKYAEKLNLIYGKSIQFVICTNLTLIDEGVLNFLKKHNVLISTSLDGSKELHNKNRPFRNNSNSYDILIDKLQLAQRILGVEKISALMATTRDSLSQFPVIVDEYVKWGFNSIFLRTINPYGRASNDMANSSYDIEEFVESYKKGLRYIIDLNLKGRFFVEEFARLLLTRILTPFCTGFVDMQSPAGIGIEGVIYNYNGDLYVSDEGRMLGEMEDKKFLMGNVNKHSYEELFNSDFMRSLISSSCLESLPYCSDCVYLPFCGADPVRNYVEQKDIIGNRMRSNVCKRNRLIIEYLLKLIEENDDNILDVFWSWITLRSLEEVKIGKS